ncbi:MAG TPA: glycosyltransferase family 39 protein [Polyangiaceae bacterium]|nr:glycosyltransferase family 39 protein [Polyangiaceae bacterium]
MNGLLSWARARSLGLRVSLRERPLSTVALACAVAASIRAGWLVAFVAWRRLGYRYDLEWMEGGMVDHARRVLDGLPIYVEPSIEWTPYIYNPLYHWLGALAMAVLGVGPVALRVVSVLATCLLLGLTAWIVRRQTGRWAAGVVACGCFLGTYELSGGWMDLARVDTTFLALQAAAVAAALLGTWPGTLGAGCLLVAAFLAKQYGVVMAAPIGLYLLVDRGWRHALAFLFIGLGGTALAVWWLNRASGGWYWFYAYELPAMHPSLHHTLAKFARSHLLLAGPGALSLGIAGLVLALRRAWPLTRGVSFRKEVTPSVLVVGVIGTLLVQAFASMNHSGSWQNCLMPLHLGVAMLVGLAVGAALEERGEALMVFVAVTLCLQFVAWDFQPQRWIPKKADLQANERIVREAERAGSVLFPHRGYFGSTSTSPGRTSQMALVDILWAARIEEVERRLYEQADAWLASKPYDRIVLDNKDWVFQRQLERHYRQISEIPYGEGPGHTPSGYPMRPRVVYAPISGRTAP